MSGSIHFRRAEQTDIPQLVGLFNSQYARKKGESYFLWQYFNSYYPTVLFCAFAKGKLIGMYGLQKRLLNNGAKVGQAIDMLVSAEFRGKGIFKQLVDKAIQYFQDVDLLCVFPNLNGKNAVVKSLGWKTAGKIDLMCVKPQSIIDISEEDSEPWGFERDQSLYRFVYDNGIRKWRFDKHPDYTYHYVSLDDEEKYAVTKIFTDPNDGRKFGDIVEFDCDLGNKYLLTRLFLKSALYLKNRGVDGITTWALPHTQLYGVVRQLGFSELSQERYFCVKVLKRKFDYLYNFNHWHLLQADAEIY